MKKLNIWREAWALYFKLVWLHSYEYFCKVYLIFLRIHICYCLCFTWMMTVYYCQDFLVYGNSIANVIDSKLIIYSWVVFILGTSPSKFLTGPIFLHAHLQAVYYNCVKFHLIPKSRLGGLKKYGRCPKFGRRDNSTCTFTKRRRACTL
jgi:hypothetical protein